MGPRISPDLSTYLRHVSRPLPRGGHIYLHTVHQYNAIFAAIENVPTFFRQLPHRLMNTELPSLWGPISSLTRRSYLSTITLLIYLFYPLEAAFGASVTISIHPDLPILS